MMIVWLTDCPKQEWYICTFISCAPVDIHISDFAHSYHGGQKIMQRQRTFKYNNISFTGFNLAILVAPEELTLGNLCSHKVC